MERATPIKRMPAVIIAGLAVATALAACGGGSDQAATRQPPPQLAQDIVPPGARVDVGGANYFPLGAGDRWDYDHLVFVTSSPAIGLAASRIVQSGPDQAGNVVLRETIGLEVDDTAYRSTEQGPVLTDPLGPGAPPGVRAIVGEVVEYPVPFYAIGGERRVVRQGVWDQDLDGDGQQEGFRLEFAQIFVGFEDRPLPVGSAPTARFSNVLQLTVSPSNPARPATTVTATEQAWFAPGIGLVRAERNVTSVPPGPATLPYALVIRGGFVNGQPLFTP